MRRLAHLSDLHFGRTDQAVVDGLAEARRALWVKSPLMMTKSGRSARKASAKPSTTA